jgi:hypothetical protein
MTSKSKSKAKAKARKPPTPPPRTDSKRLKSETPISDRDGDDRSGSDGDQLEEEIEELDSDQLQELEDLKTEIAERLGLDADIEQNRRFLQRFTPNTHHFQDWYQAMEAEKKRLWLKEYENISEDMKLKVRSFCFILPYLTCSSSLSFHR